MTDTVAPRAFHIEGADLLAQDQIRAVVRATYGGVRPADGRVARRYYRPEQLQEVPEETVRIALGVGNPVSFAQLRPGEDVVDLGSGGGIDCLTAARAVAPDGSVVGVDFLAEMVERASAAAAAAGIPNVRFVQGEIEALPLPDASVDVVISNGVVYIGSGDQNVYALDATTGTLRWSFATGDVVHASPAVANGLVYIGSWDRNIYALDATTGRERCGHLCC